MLENGSVPIFNTHRRENSDHIKKNNDINDPNHIDRVYTENEKKNKLNQKQDRSARIPRGQRLIQKKKPKQSQLNKKRAKKYHNKKNINS
jgi:hypothetical protein